MAACCGGCFIAFSSQSAKPPKQKTVDPPSAVSYQIVLHTRFQQAANVRNVMHDDARQHVSESRPITTLEEKLVTDEIPSGAVSYDVSGQTKLQQASSLRNILRDSARHHFSVFSPLTSQEENWMTDEILGIYVRARKTQSERLAILVPTLEWRISNREALESCDCPYCATNPLSHDARLFGFDSEGDFVFMNCFELPHDISVDSVTRHMTCLLERALNEYPVSPNASVEQDGHPKIRKWSFVFDLYGFGLRYYDPRVTMRLLELFQVVHRGRLKKLYVLDAPCGFWSFWQIVKTFLKAETVAKLEFSDWRTIRPHFESIFGVTLARELSEEAIENRDLQRAAVKRWTTFYGSSLEQIRTRNRVAAEVKPKPVSGSRSEREFGNEYQQPRVVDSVATTTESCARLNFWSRLRKCFETIATH